MKNWIMWLDKAEKRLGRLVDEPTPSVWDALEKSQKKEPEQMLKHVKRELEGILSGRYYEVNDIIADLKYLIDEIERVDE